MATKIKILSTSDIHGRVYPYSYAKGGEEKQEAWNGLARLSTLINRLRDENTILIDNGDTIEGSPLTFFHYLKNQDKTCPVSLAMREIGYDYVNVGNHDFNYGARALFLHVLETGATCITSNFYYRGEQVGKPYVLKKIAGKTIAIIGVVTQHIPYWEAPDNIRDMYFADAFDTLRNTVNILKEKEKPDYIIAVYHGGFEKDPVTEETKEKQTDENEGYRMARDIKGIDILISGHHHRKLCGKLHDTYYTQPADKGTYLSCVTIDTVTGEITPELLSLEDVEPDPAILELAGEEEDACQIWLDQTLGVSNVDLKIHDENEARLEKAQLVTFLNKVQMEVTGAEISAAGVYLGATGFEREITMRSLVSTYIYPNTLVVKRMSGKALRAYLEKCAAFWCVKDGKIVIDPQYDFPTPQHYNYDMLDGVEYTLKISNPVGKRVVSLTRNGEEITGKMRFTVCINNYRASGGGGFDMVLDCATIKEVQTGMVDILAKYIMEHKTIDFEPVHNVKLII